MWDDEKRFRMQEIEEVYNIHEIERLWDTQE